MLRWKKIALAIPALLAITGVIAYWYWSTSDEREPSRLAYAEHCSNCHGAALEGSDTGPALADRTLDHGDATPELIASIKAHRVPESPDWASTLPPHTIKALALYISEQRQAFPTTRESQAYAIPSGVIPSRHHDFRVEHITDFESGPYSMAPLPSGEILLVEKVRGLTIVDKSGKQSELIEGTPRVWGEIARVSGSYVGLGMMLDVELHPDYASNGWIYISHGDRCQLDCGSLVPQTMVRVVRGRIRDGLWVDTEPVWSVDTDQYTTVPDNVAAGRLAFDKTGHVYLTVGGKAHYRNLHILDTPYGKIHRVRDDGSVPEDNPFWQPPQDRAQPSSRHTVWSYGHRTTQGLAAHPESGQIWATEMGPRGGDEVNRIVRGGNYGWPLYTEGLDYDGEPLTIGEDLGLDFPYSETIPPVVDFTPAPAISNFTFHKGDKFPRWKNDLLVGSLRARTLYRLRIENDQLIEKEKLLDSLGRIRDVEMGPQGLVYVLIEHQDGGSLVRLVPQ
jgi:glucose/arabinose dehydrogenase